MSDFNEKNPFESGSGDWAPSPEPEKEETGVQLSQENQGENNSAEFSDNPYENGLYENPQEGNTPKKNGMATAAMVLGIVSLSVTFVCCCFTYITWIVSIICGIVGTVLGIVALAKGGMNTKALVGLILSIVAVVLSFIGIVVLNANVDLLMQFIRENYPDIYDQYFSEPNASPSPYGMIITGLLSLFGR